jgi:hypothetical protein
MSVGLIVLGVVGKESVDAEVSYIAVESISWAQRSS